MSTKPKVVAFLPAKGASERVANKNTRIFNGEPFFAFTLRKLLRCPFIDEVYLDSESDEILAIGERLGAKILRRDPALASNKTDGHHLFYNEARQVQADVYIQHLCTSPFIKEETIRRAVETLLANPALDSVVLGRRDKYYHWQGGRPAYDIARIPNSSDLPAEDTEAMGLYVVRGDAARRTRRRIGDTPLMMFGDPMELIDVNEEADLELAKIIAAGVLAEEGKKLKLIGAFLSSPVISDIADELGLNTVLSPHYKPNFTGARLFGRARPLHIREATADDPSDAIYQALKHYHQVVSNDLIVVQTDRPDLAYFGELNMSLSIRAGAVGALIGGVTRDNEATSRAGFPVYSRGHYCRDIKGHGAVAAINEPIELDGVRINPSDLLFGDEDGIVVIPRERELAVLKRAVEVLTKERHIVADVCSDADVASLVNKYGFF